MLKDDQIEQICKLEKSIFNDFYSKNMIIDMLKNTNYHTIIVEDLKIIGYVIINSVLDECEIMHIAVDENARRKGIGNQLIAKLIDHAKSEKIVKIHLEVRESNISAISLYKKHGFKIISTRKKYYTNPDENGIIMMIEV